ncbi:hypothetical protein M569_06053, partial [Genlisea aurea]
GSRIGHQSLRRSESGHRRPTSQLQHCVLGSTAPPIAVAREESSGELAARRRRRIAVSAVAAAPTSAAGDVPPLRVRCQMHPHLLYI